MSLMHIAEFMPTNAVIITDGDPEGGPDVTLPGAMWMLFYNYRSDYLLKHLRGKKQTKIYDVQYFNKG